jgi:RNA polymerase sigma factor (TIGR02999 family)
MAGDPAAQLTQVLQAVVRGERDAAARLLPLVYDDLKALARARMGKIPPGNTLQPTALVHEAYMRLIGGVNGQDPGWEGRAHFFGAAARAMRDILVEQARRKAGPKAGGGRKREALDAADREQTPPIDSPAGLGESVVALSRALTKLEELDPRKAEVVLLKFFTGLDHEQIASMLGTSIPTVERDWRFARAWLSKEMQSEVPEV